MDENSVDRVWDIPDDSDFFHQEVCSLEYRAYGSVLSAFRARGELNEERRNALNLMRETLGISEVRHKCEIRRVATNPRLTMIANKIQGYNTTQAWVDEGFCDTPYLSSIPRLPHAPAKLPETVLDEVEQGKAAEVSRESKLKPTIRDFRKAQKIEKNFPSTFLNGWVSSDDDGKRGSSKGKGKMPRRISTSKNGKVIRQRKLSHPVPDSDTDDEISYKDLRRQGRIHVPKNFKEGSKDGEAPEVASAFDSARLKDDYQVSPIRIKEEDESDETPTMHDAFVPKRKIAAAKSKSAETIGAIPQVKKQKHGNSSTKHALDGTEIPLDFSEGYARSLTSSESLPHRPTSTRGRGRGMSRGAGTRGMGRKAVPKVLLPTSKRKHLDEARVELRSDGESDKDEIQEGSEHPSPPRTLNVNGYRREFGSPVSANLCGESPEVLKTEDEILPILESPKHEEIESNQQKLEMKNYSSGDEMKPRQAAPKPVIVRPPFPPPVFSTTLDVNSFNKKRTKFGESDIPTSAMVIGPTASSLARRPHLLNTSQGMIIRPTGILSQRKAQPHILANSKTQRLITSPLPAAAGSMVQNNIAGVSPSSIVASGPNIVAVQSVQFVPSEHNLQQQQTPASSSIVTVSKPTSSFSIPMSTMQSISFSSTSASTVVPSKQPGSPSIILLQKPGGTPMPITSLSTNSGGGPSLNANIQYSTINLQKGNNHRAVILRRANLPLNKGNVMILNSPADVALLSNLHHGSPAGAQIGRIVPASLPQSVPGTVTFSSSPILFSSPSAPSTSVAFSNPVSTIESTIISSFAPTYESVKLQDSTSGTHRAQEWRSALDQAQVQASSSKESLTSEGQTNSLEDTLSAKSESQETVLSSESQPNLTQVLDDYLGSLLSTEEMPEEAPHDQLDQIPVPLSVESLLPISTEETKLAYSDSMFVRSSMSQFGQNPPVSTSPDIILTPTPTIGEVSSHSKTNKVEHEEHHEYLPHFEQEEHVYMEPDHTEVVEEEVIATDDGLVPDAHASSSFDSLTFSFDATQAMSELNSTDLLSNAGTTENVFENHLDSDSINGGSYVIPDQLMASDDVAVELEITPEEVETITTTSALL